MYMCHNNFKEKISQGFYNAHHSILQIPIKHVNIADKAQTVFKMWTPSDKSELAPVV